MAVLTRYDSPVPPVLEGTANRVNCCISLHSRLWWHGDGMGMAWWVFAGVWLWLGGTCGGGGMPLQKDADWRLSPLPKDIAATVIS